MTVSMTIEDAVRDYLQNYPGKWVCTKEVLHTAIQAQGLEITEVRLSVLISQMINDRVLIGWRKSDRRRHYSNYRFQTGWERLSLTEYETKFCLRRRREQSLQFKQPCAKCGETRLHLIQFHHIDPKTKEFCIGASHKRTEELEKEVKKCVCLCANCHAEYHFFYGRNPKNPIETLQAYLHS